MCWRIQTYTLNPQPPEENHTPWMHSIQGSSPAPPFHWPFLPSSRVQSQGNAHISLTISCTFLLPSLWHKLDPLLGIPSHLSKILTSASSLRLKALWSDVSRRIIPFLHGPLHSAHPFIKKHYPIFKFSTYPSKPTVSRSLKTAIIFSCEEQRRKTICSAHPKGTTSCHC